MPLNRLIKRSTSVCLSAIGAPPYFFLSSVFFVSFLAVDLVVVFLADFGLGFTSLIIRTYPIDSWCLASFSGNVMVDRIGLRLIFASVSTLYFFFFFKLLSFALYCFL